MARLGCYLNLVENSIENGDSKQLMDLKEKIVRELSSVNRVSEKNLLLSLHSSRNIDVVSNHIAEMWIPQEWKKMKFAALR